MQILELLRKMNYRRPRGRGLAHLGNTNSFPTAKQILLNYLWFIGILAVVLPSLYISTTVHLASERDYQRSFLMPINCPLQNLDPSFRTVTIKKTPTSSRYKMFLHGPSKDIFISDSIFNSRGKLPFEKNVQVLMDRQLRGRVPSETTILDIGANIGSDCLHLASMGYRVHAFEPATENYDLLQCSKAESRFDNLILNNFGLSSEDARPCMKLNPYNQGAHRVKRAGACPEEERVTVRTLDDYYDRVLSGVSPYMIKIDVEGHEMFVFMGGEKMFKKDPPKVIFSEVEPFQFSMHGQNVMQYFEFFWKYNYNLYLVENTQLKLVVKGNPTPSDLSEIVMVHSSIDPVQ